MTRRQPNYGDFDRDRTDYIRTWRDYPEEMYNTGTNYTHQEKAKRNKSRNEWPDSDYVNYSKDEKGKKFSGQCPMVEDNPHDYENYTYKYNTLTYSRSPAENSDVRSKEHKRKEQTSPPRRRYSDNQRNPKHEREKRKENNREHRAKQSGHNKEDSYDDRYALDHAATKIQSVFRGYQTRKDYWKKLEQHRRESLLNAKEYHQDNYTNSSVTSFVDDASISSLVNNVDPNLGLTASLPYVDNAQRHNIIRDLKSTLSYSEDISLVSQLQSESSANIIILGGINPPQAKDYMLGASIFVYNIQKDRWFFGGTMPEPRNYHTAACLGGKIYVIGGYNPLEIIHHQMIATQSVFELSIRSKRWRKRASMHQARACHATCVVNDHIVVLGGRDAQGKLLSTVEAYNPKKDQWDFYKPLPEAVMGLSCTVYDGCVFAIGGIVNEGHASRYAVSNHVCAFDLERLTWYKAPSLPEPRAFACAATLKKEIWLWCGVKEALNEDGYLISTNSVLVYNPDAAKWEHHMNVGTMKHAVAIAKYGRRVYILGGMSNSSGCKEVLNENDYYNRETDKYMEGASLPRPLTGTAAVVIPTVSASDPKWSSENIDEDVMNKAAAKIQAAYRGHRVRSITSNHKFPAYSSSAEGIIRNDFIHSFHAATFTEADKRKALQRIQIEDWPPVPDLQASNSEVNLKFGAIAKGYTVTSTHNRAKIRRYVCLTPDADPNLSMIGHLCNVSKRAKKILGLRKVERLPACALNLTVAPTLQDDCLPVLLTLGGLEPKDPVNLSNGKLILRYHTLKNRWEYFGALPEPRNYHAAVYYQENIYVSGGCNPDKVNSGEMVATNTMYCLNIHSSEWVEKAEMHCCRSHHGLVVALGKIFAIGGRDNNGRLIASIEAYDVENNKWSMLRPMINPRMGMACAVVDDHIWCMGGIGVTEESESYPVLSSVISYDIGKDVWIHRPPLRCPRAYGSCVVIYDNMWLVGGASKDHGHDVLVSMGSVDKYSPVEATWERKTLINNPRHCAAIVAIDTCIYILGGVSSQEWSPLAKNEMIVTDDISHHPFESLPVPLTGLAAVAVPPVVPSLRSESFAILMHTKLTYH